MKKTLQILIGLVGVLFLFTGIRWLLDPGTAAQSLGMPLLEGIGRSTQIGDLASFFLSLGFMIFAGLITGRRVWFYPPVMLLGLAALSRVVAWLVHDAALAMQLIVSELVIAALLFFVSARISQSE